MRLTDHENNPILSDVIVWFGGGSKPKAPKGPWTASKAEFEAASKEGFEAHNKLLETYRPEQEGLTGRFSTGLNANVDKYALDTDEALTRYNDAVASLVGKSDANTEAFALRSKNLAAESADETFNYNRSRLDDFTAFSDRMSQANQTTRQGLINNANPSWQAQKEQAALNNLQMQQGVLSADVAAQAARSGAEGLVNSGVGWGALGANRVARDFGLTSLDLKQKGQQNSMAWQSQIYNQEVAGNQVTTSDVYNTNGLNAQSVYNYNHQNNMTKLAAQNEGLSYSMNALGNALSTKGTAATNEMSARNAALSQAYTQESEVLRDYMSGKVGAVTDRTNVKVGIASQGLANSYANANRTLQSGLATANIIGSTISNIGGSVLGAAIGGAFGGGAFSNGSAYAASQQAGATSMQDLNLSGI
jgi:hypothetical protein